MCDDQMLPKPVDSGRWLVAGDRKCWTVLASVAQLPRRLADEPPPAGSIAAGTSSPLVTVVKAIWREDRLLDGNTTECSKWASSPRCQCSSLTFPSLSVHLSSPIPRSRSTRPSVFPFFPSHLPTHATRSTLDWLSQLAVVAVGRDRVQFATHESASRVSAVPLHLYCRTLKHHGYQACFPFPSQGCRGLCLLPSSQGKFHTHNTVTLIKLN
jgi:hypothetical protein